MTEYTIHHWFAITSGSANTPSPILYIDADHALIEFARVNSNALMCTIHDSGTPYDGNSYPCLFQKALMKDMYTITLASTWSGYPPSNDFGTVTFKGFEQTSEMYEKENATQNEDKKNKNEENTSQGHNTKRNIRPYIYALIAVLLLLSIALILKK